jgi:Leucine-rich repeat (LRR) protein
MEDKDIQKEDIQTCRELLEIEPTCKWALITLMWYDSKKEDYISSLLSMDTLHEGYYRDVWSDGVIHSSNVESNTTTLNLSHLSLTRFNKINEFKELKSIDLSNNDILYIPRLNLNQLEYLNLNNNKIEFLEGVSHLTCLQTLLLKNNRKTNLIIHTLVIQFLPSNEILSNSLVELDISNNPIQVTLEELKEHFPKLK